MQEVVGPGVGQVTSSRSLLTVVTAYAQRRERRHRMVESLAQCHTAGYISGLETN